MKFFFLLCALCCFIAVLRLPIDYYTFLRIVIFIGAGVALYHLFRNKIYYWTAVFGFILILFNPIFPVYLHRKSLWVPLDIITGILFLCLNFIKKKPEEEKEVLSLSEEPVTHTRDRIMNPQTLKQNK
ncbi:hypothetical protein C8J95_106215 [Elizabethkingia sp. YR214]|uniref:DUF6804 family protein n=1 Tax=Elizabethkingia sp. YR214 TaxID=2135667 RepID=UPI000D3096DA|nr:DUF6804 family protein [Elizabethkingia sp. YR214]PUB29560.1 hypothetical protein C8J95_106215 [Elizabethkingia sp. YR214]